MSGSLHERADPHDLIVGFSARVDSRESLVIATDGDGGGHRGLVPPPLI
jgi:hypothetical protein